MVVNQEQGGEGGGGKVQCILISRAQEGAGRPAASAPVPASCPHGEKTTTPSTTTAGPLREQNGTPKAPVVQNGIPKSASVVHNGTPKIPVVQNGTPKTSSTVANGTAKANDGGFVDVFKDVKFQCRPLTRTGGEEKKGMQEISLLQYDKMDRKERIKTGYSLGEREKGGLFSFCYDAIVKLLAVLWIRGIFGTDPDPHHRPTDPDPHPDSGFSVNGGRVANKK
jgi:hypothetical protein